MDAQLAESTGHRQLAASVEQGLGDQSDERPHPAGGANRRVFEAVELSGLECLAERMPLAVIGVEEGRRRPVVLVELGPADGYLGVLAPATGYADQARMTREFRATSGLAPASIRDGLDPTEIRS